MRRRVELSPDYFRVDERDIADLIIFGRRYARYVRFYDVPAAGVSDDVQDWSSFFESDVSANLAALAKLPIEKVMLFQADLETFLKADPARDPAVLGSYFKLVFHLPLAMLQEAGAIAEWLPATHPLRTVIEQMARRDLVQPIRSLIAWYKAASEPGSSQLFSDDALKDADYKLGPVSADARLRLPPSIQAGLLGRQSLGQEPLPNIVLNGTDWQPIWDDVKSDDAPYRDAGAKTYERIHDALEYNLMSSAVRGIYRALAQLKAQATSDLESSLEEFGTHDAHYGLWLTFLRLFRHAQQSLNGFTARHLDFYFREVLQLRSRTSVPDHVHLLFELAKDVKASPIAAGTSFRAGKDALGNPLCYELEQDLIVNRGRVGALYALRQETTDAGTLAFASTEVRSLDGVGKQPLLSDRPQWPAFGPETPPKARIGFAISDRRLFLREGSRTIRISAEIAKSPKFIPASEAWRVRLTGEKGWFEPEGALTVTVEDVASDYFDAQVYRDLVARRRAMGARIRPRLEFRVELAADAPAIVPFDPKIHEGQSAPDGRPRIEICFDFDRTTAATAFEGMADTRLLNVEVETSAAGLKQLRVDAGGASVNPAKPFAAFGPQPKAGAALVIGSSEIFSKPLSQLSITLDWQEEYSASKYFRSKNPSDYTAEADLLASGQWQDIGKGLPLFSSGRSVTLNFGGSKLASGNLVEPGINPEFDTAAIAGFIRFSLSDDFGHLDYPAEYARALVKMAKGDDYDPPDIYYFKRIVAPPGPVEGDWSRMREFRAVNDQRSMPLPPYDPIITRIEAAYRSTLGPAEHFVHLLPFGEVIARPSDGQLFPSFDFAGALLLGIADLEPPARLSLLIQVADGTADPLRRPPKLRFEYLSGDCWKQFEGRSVDDKTRGFTNSGILGLAVPTEADRNHGAMPSGYHWFRISAREDVDGLNQLLSIDAQAGRAAFVDCENDPAFLTSPLPPKAISKFTHPDPRIKKIAQPYSSFGGKPAEDRDAFTTRVSERLRHKDRAVTPFDYEALILEAFPKLYRAKCLPTTAMVRDEADRIIADNEVAPGAVTVVTIPWTHGVNTRNPLRPFADQALLADVERFLKRRLSPFARVEVQNPKFEEVQAAFKVKFNPEIADIAFHREELNNALVEFLTPWARQGSGEIMFGGKLWKSSLIDFVEERPEVDFVTEFKLFHKPEADADDGSWTPVDVEVIEVTTARSILVSAAHHLIEEVATDA